jgi:phosphoglycerol transferase MdoB-like AlkP superfamily enzyme
LPYVGFFVISLGISLLFFTLVADKVGFGHPGVGPYEKIGFMLSAVVTILGVFLIYKSKW